MEIIDIIPHYADKNERQAVIQKQYFDLQDIIWNNGSNNQNKEIVKSKNDK